MNGKFYTIMISAALVVIAAVLVFQALEMKACGILK